MTLKSQKKKAALNIQINQTILKRSGYIVFILVVLAIGFGFAFFNGYIRWPYGEPEGNLNKAIAEFERAVELEPGNAETYQYLSLAYRLNGQPDKAIALYEQAIAANSDQAQLYLGLGTLYLEEGQIQPAATIFQQATDIDPDDALICLDIARTLRQYDYNQEAQAYAQQAVTLALDSDTAGQAYRELGLVYLAQQNTEEAGEALLNALSASPANPWVQLSVGDFYFWHKNTPDKAISHYRQAVQLVPDQAVPYLALGRALLKTGSQSEGLQVLKRAGSIDSTSDVQTQIGQILLQFNLPDLAQPYFEQAVTLNPTNIQAYLDLAVLHRQQQDYQAALDYTNQARNIAQDETKKGQVYLEQGLILQAQGKKAEAGEAFSLALAALPTDAQAHITVGSFYEWDQNKIETAIDYYRQAITLAPDKPEYHVFLGKALLKTADHVDEGLEVLQTALSLANQDSSIYLAVGQLAYDQQNWPRVVQIYEMALAAGAANVEIYIQLGDAYQALGELDQAMMMYHQAAQLEPDNSMIQQRLQDSS